MKFASRVPPYTYPLPNPPSPSHFPANELSVQLRLRLALTHLQSALILGPDKEQSKSPRRATGHTVGLRLRFSSVRKRMLSSTAGWALRYSFVSPVLWWLTSVCDLGAVIRCAVRERGQRCLRGKTPLAFKPYVDIHLELENCKECRDQRH